MSAAKISFIKLIFLEKEPPDGTVGERNEKVLGAHDKHDKNIHFRGLGTCALLKQSLFSTYTWSFLIVNISLSI